MSRICTYLVNDSVKYMEMARNSIQMLRQHNATIPVRVFLVSNKHYFELQWHKDYFSFYDVEVLIRKPLLVPGEEKYFPINKVILRECDEDRVLFIDSDTFIFGDVAKLFDMYAPYSAVACWNTWVYTRGWTENLLAIRPINSGIMLWDGKWLKRACDRLPEYCAELRSGDTPLSRWLWALDGTCWQREEFAYSLFIERENLPHRHFMRQDCLNIRNEEDFVEGAKSIIFHTYTNQWKRMYDMIHKMPK